MCVGGGVTRGGWGVFRGVCVWGGGLVMGGDPS